MNLLPETPAQFREAMKRAIEHFQGSPVSNENKLNESMARALGYSNYNKLSPALAEFEKNGNENAQANSEEQKAERKIKTLHVWFDYNGEQAICIGDARLPVELDHEGIISITVVDAEAREDDIDLMIGESTGRNKSGDRELMRDDRDYLRRSTDEFVLEYSETNGFVAADLDPDTFNNECLAALKAALEYRPDGMNEDDYEEYIATIESSLDELRGYMAEYQDEE